MQFKRIMFDEEGIEAFNKKCISCGALILIFGKGNNVLCPHCTECLDNGNTLVLEVVRVEDDCLVVNRIILLSNIYLTSKQKIIAISDPAEFERLYNIYIQRNG